MKKLNENHKLLIVSGIALASVFYLFKKSGEGTVLEGVDGLNVDIDSDKLTSSIGNKIINNPKIIKTVGKSVLNNERVQNGAKNLASRAILKMMKK